MKHICYLIALFLYSPLGSQCPSGSVILSTQAEVDNFVISYPDCEEIDGSLFLGQSGAPMSSDITDISGLSSIKRIQKDLRLRILIFLETFEGLHNVTYVGTDLVVGDNEVLKNLNSLSGLDTVGRSINIYRNPALQSLFSANNLAFLGESLDIIENENLITIDGFSTIEFVTGSVDIASNPMLINLMGLDGIKTIEEGINIYNTGVSDLHGLEGLRSVMGKNAGSISISNNPNLISLSGLEALDSTYTSLNLAENPLLTSLNALKSLEYIGLALRLEQIPILNFEELESLDSLRGEISLVGNPDLTSLSGLKFGSVMTRSIRIDENPSIIDIKALETIDTIKSGLFITDNISLGDCEPICQLLKEGVVLGATVIDDNFNLCASEATVELECIVSASDLPKDVFQISYTNPVSDRIEIKFDKSIDATITFMDIGGRIFKKSMLSKTIDYSMDISDIVTGIYLMNITTAKTQKTIKFIINN